MYGFVDSLGNVVIKPKYKYVGEFRSGYACVITGAKLNVIDFHIGNDTLLQIKYGYIDTNDNLVIDTTNIVTLRVEPAMYSFPQKLDERQLEFRDIVFQDLDLVNDRYVFQDEKNQRFGYKNSEGKVVIEPRFLYAKAFSNGRAVVSDTLDMKSFKTNGFDVTKLNNYGAIDTNGNQSVGFEYSYIAPFGKDKETWASFFSQKDGSLTKEWVLLEENGKVIIPPSPYDHMYNSNDGIYIVQISMLGETRYTFMDKAGKYLTDHNNDGEIVFKSYQKGVNSEMFDDVTAFSDGYAGVKCTYGKDNVWTFINEHLDFNFPPYDSLQCFSGGLAAVKEYIEDSGFGIKHGGKWGYIDKDTNIMIPYQYSDCGSFKGPLAYFKKWGSTYDIEGYINKKGNIVWQTRRKK